MTAASVCEVTLGKRKGVACQSPPGLFPLGGGNLTTALYLFPPLPFCRGEEKKSAEVVEKGSRNKGRVNSTVVERSSITELAAVSVTEPRPRSEGDECGKAR